MNKSNTLYSAIFSFKLLQGFFSNKNDMISGTAEYILRIL